MKLVRFLGGHIGYYFAILLSLFGFREKLFTIRNDQLYLKRKLFLLVVTNAVTTGGGFKVSPHASVHDGLLDLVISSPLSILKRVINLPKVKKGNHLGLPFVWHYTGAEFTIECETELPAQIDGELIYAKTFRYGILKDKFLFRY